MWTTDSHCFFFFFSETNADMSVYLVLFLFYDVHACLCKESRVFQTSAAVVWRQNIWWEAVLKPLPRDVARKPTLY